MLVDLNAGQRELADVARKFFADTFPPRALRQSWDGMDSAFNDMWRRLGALGVFGLASPSEAGGLGQSEVEVVAVVEEAGYVALPHPLIEQLVAIGILGVCAGELQNRWLPPLLAGDCVATVQWGDRYPVPYADVADLLVVHRGGDFHLVPAGRFAASRVPSLDPSQRLFRVEPQLSRRTRLDLAHTVVSESFDRGATAAAAFLVGLSARLLDFTVTHVSERQQFGRAVGSFQAVQHRLAEAHTAIEVARPAVWVAAYLLSRSDPMGWVAASVAKAAVNDAARTVNDAALQCHGGIGFTWESDLHMWLKRSKILEYMYGSSLWHRNRIAAFLFDGQGSVPTDGRGFDVRWNDAIMGVT